MPYRRVWFSGVSLRDKMLSSLILIFWKTFCLGMKKLVQWRKKCTVDSISLSHSHKGFKVSWKQCLNLYSCRWLRLGRSRVKSLIPRGLWILKIILEQDRMKFKSFFLKVLKFAEFLILRPSLFHSVIAEGKNEFLKESCLTLIRGFYS